MPIFGGIFVGGASTRMGGRPKGLLPHPSGGTLVDHLAGVLRAVGAEVVLVGANDAYAASPWPRLADSPAGVGPMGGLCALLERTDTAALAVACDMPFIDADDLRQLLAARGERLAVAPVRAGRFEPLCALYERGALEIARQRLTEDRRSLQGLLRALDPTPVTLPPDHLDDWDSPEDITDA